MLQIKGYISKQRRRYNIKGRENYNKRESKIKIENWGKESRVKKDKI